LWVLNTYRWYGHSKSDPQIYRDHQEVEAWKEKCPLKTLRNRGINELGMTASDFDGIDKTAEQAVTAACTAALGADAGAVVTPEQLLGEVYG
jgi:pyruvate dehydrogenase E1 component alpha subunit